MILPYFTNIVTFWISTLNWLKPRSWFVRAKKLGPVEKQILTRLFLVNASTAVRVKRQEKVRSLWRLDSNLPATLVIL